MSAGDAAFLISAGGMSNTMGRLAGGWMSDLPQLQPLTITVMCLAAAAVPAMLISLCWAYWTFLVAFGAFGFFSGTEVIYQPKKGGLKMIAAAESVGINLPFQCMDWDPTLHTWHNLGLCLACKQQSYSEHWKGIRSVHLISSSRIL